MRQVKLMAGLDKSRTCVRNVVKIENFTNSHTWFYFNEYVHGHIFSVSWVYEAILRNEEYIKLTTMCTSEHCDEFFTSCFTFSVLWFKMLSYFSKVIHSRVVYRLFSLLAPLILEVQKTIDEKAKIQTPRRSVWNAFILWNYRKMHLFVHVRTRIFVLILQSSYNHWKTTQHFCFFSSNTVHVDALPYS